MGFNSDRHFVDERFAILFAPGTYTGIDIEVGYYVQLAGLGAKAGDVVFKDCERGPFVEALNKHHIVGGRPGLSLDTFWRAAENFRTEATQGQLWAVSQAAPLRRVDIAGPLLLHDNGAQASGGHLANARVAGPVDFGSQQQWLARSVEFGGGVTLGAWSMVFTDCTGRVPEPSAGAADAPAVTVDAAPALTVEKPFVALRPDGRFELRVPAPRQRRAEGPAAAAAAAAGPLGPDLEGADDDVRGFERVFVARAGEMAGAAAARINAALAEGKDVVLSPGVYHLEAPVVVSRPNQVVLGLGLATLVAPPTGEPCLRVAARTPGVRVAGLMLEASVIPPAEERGFTATLLEWGEEEEEGPEGAAAATPRRRTGQQREEGNNPFEAVATFFSSVLAPAVGQPGAEARGATKDPGDPGNPGVLTDVFARVGGSNPDRRVATDVMVRLHAGHLYGDNLWLWRADHVALRAGEAPNFPPLDYHQVVLGECPCATGLEVCGDDVTLHGLAVEHTQGDQVVWRGERGEVQFYQSELPYEADAAFGRGGHAGYRVAPGVARHRAAGVGVYSNFRDHEVPVAAAVRHEGGRPGVVFENAFTVLLNNKGLIRSVVNGRGGPAAEKGKPVRLRLGEEEGGCCVS
uniref:Uncharacterized protein n=1 Tax=Heterosigma akashiwo TaxID=2829 RepID=A0A7S3XUP5_HETAK